MSIRLLLAASAALTIGAADAAVARPLQTAAPSTSERQAWVLAQARAFGARVASLESGIKEEIAAAFADAAEVAKRDPGRFAELFPALNAIVARHQPAADALASDFTTFMDQQAVEAPEERRDRIVALSAEGAEMMRNLPARTRDQALMPRFEVSPR
ncbi:MAG TPA: hypothetical protein VLJ13_03805 [Brevundimonas sp.]|nr:hypothetical protein [Brevundimonas sp.]